MNKKEVGLDLIGILFLIFGIIAIINSFVFFNVSQIFWFCYLGIIIIGVGILKRSSLLIISQLNILLIPLLIWSFDFFYYLIQGNSLLGIVDYMFESGFFLPRLISLQHIFTIPLSFYVLFKLKKSENYSWAISIAQVSLLFFITRIFTLFEENINWVYSTSLNLNLPFYPLFWFAVIFSLIFLTDFFIKLVLFNSKS